MLNLCRSFDFVPKEIEIIHDNRDYFRRYTVDKLDTRVNGSLGHTDGAVYVDNTRFRDKYGYYVPWYGLSTGGMTVLNVLYNPDKCFDLVECGIDINAEDTIYFFDRADLFMTEEVENMIYESGSAVMLVDSKRYQLDSDDVPVYIAFIKRDKDRIEVVTEC